MNQRLSRIAQRVCTIFAREVRDVRLSTAAIESTSQFRSVEGMALGVSLMMRYALDPARASAMSKSLPDEVASRIVAVTNLSKVSRGTFE